MPRGVREQGWATAQVLSRPVSRRLLGVEIGGPATCWGSLQPTSRIGVLSVACLGPSCPSPDRMLSEPGSDVTRQVIVP